MKKRFLQIGIVTLSALIIFTNTYGKTSKQVKKAIITEYGIIEYRGEMTQFSDPESIAGKISYGIENKAYFINKTVDIPLKKGVIFGYRWKIVGVVPGKKINITYKVSHPMLTSPNGYTSKGSEGVFEITPKDRTYDMINAYKLSEDFEMIKGIWTISVLRDGEIIAEMSFNVGGK